MTASVVYEGQLRCNATHTQSGTQVETDAPTDNRGKGERFLPQILYVLALQPALSLLWALKPRI
jgi:hypothetical protein